MSGGFNSTGDGALNGGTCNALQRIERRRRTGKIWLYRSLLDPPATLIRDALMLQLWVYFLLRATYKPRSVKVSTGRGKTTVELSPGQLLVGVPSLSQFTGAKPRTIRDKIAGLVRMGCIECRSKTHFSVVTITNWNAYQKAQKHREANREANSRPNDATQRREANQLGNTRPEKELRNANVDSTRCNAATQSREAVPPKTRDKQISITSKGTTNNSRRALRFDVGDRELAEFMLAKIRQRLPGFKSPSLDAWGNDVRLARERDGRSIDDLRAVFEFADADPFWQANILSPSKLREKFDTLSARMRAPHHANRNAPPSPSRIHSGNQRKPLRVLSNAPIGAGTPSIGSEVGPLAPQS